jgi:hypothetical protein
MKTRSSIGRLTEAKLGVVPEKTLGFTGDSAYLFVDIAHPLCQPFGVIQ